MRYDRYQIWGSTVAARKGLLLSLLLRLLLRLLLTLLLGLLLQVMLLELSNVLQPQGNVLPLLLLDQMTLLLQALLRSDLTGASGSGLSHVVTFVISL
jgi:hypothetical protein